MAGPELTPELLAQLEGTSFWKTLPVDRGDGEQLFVHENWLPALVAAAKERDQLRSQLEKEEADSSAIIDERDALHSRIDEIADALGDETEWSNCNDRGERALEIASEVAHERDRLRADIDQCQALILEVMRERDEAREEVERMRAAAPILPVSAEVEALVDGLMRANTPKPTGKRVLSPVARAGGAAAPLLVHIDRGGESLCGMETHEGVVPLAANRVDVTCVGCWILAVDELHRIASELADMADGARSCLGAESLTRDGVDFDVRIAELRGEIERKP